MKKIIIERTEQWEYTAYGYGIEATGSSEMSAELNLLRRVVDMLEEDPVEERRQQLIKKEELKLKYKEE
jgi:hypothetical protein